MELKRPYIIKWLTSKESARYAHPVIAVLLLSLLILIGSSELSHRRQRRFEARLMTIKVSLSYLHNASEVFFNENGRYPDSFNELRRICVDRLGKDSYYAKMYIDLTSDRTSEVPEYRELNDKGGYYYNPNTGQVRLNLTRRVKEYLPGYRGWLSDQIPSTWED